jgi:hypothetical protein
MLEAWWVAMASWTLPFHDHIERLQRAVQEVAAHGLAAAEEEEEEEEEETHCGLPLAARSARAAALLEGVVGEDGLDAALP